jgi:hypothetical protein
MNYRVISLTPDHFDSARKNSRPVTCKFVLLALRDESAFVYGPVSRFAYHAALVDRFCAERGIPASWERQPDLVTVLDKQVQVRGGGWLRFDWSAGRVEIYGSSKAYGTYDDSLLRQILGDNRRLHGLPVVLSKGTQAL